jgi:type II secretory pathway pseudopilin PulG
VIAVIGVLAAVAVPAFVKYQKRAQAAAAEVQRQMPELEEQLRMLDEIDGPGDAPHR